MSGDPVRRHMSSVIADGAVMWLQQDGFLLTKVTDAARNALMATFDVACEFFRLPQEEKYANKLPHDCGYRPTGVEYSLSPERPDPIESFSASVRTCTLAEELPSLSARLLHHRMLTVIEHVEPIAEALIKLIAQALSNEETIPLHGALHRWSSLQLNCSRATDTSEFINEVHEDGHLVTIAYADSAGMEIRTPGNQFIPITNAHDEVLIMPGEIASLLSGGQIKPLYHRVRRYHARQRLALLFFADIDPRLCVPWVKNDANANIDIGRRVLENAHRFGLHGFSWE